MSRLNLGRFVDCPDWRFIDFQYTFHVIGGKLLCIGTRIRNRLTAHALSQLLNIRYRTTLRIILFMDLAHQLVFEMHEIWKLELFPLPDKRLGEGAVKQTSSLERAVLCVWNRGYVSSVVCDRGKVSSFRNLSCSEHYTVNRVKEEIILGFCKEFFVYLKHKNPH